MNAEVENIRIPSILQPLPSKQDLLGEIEGSHDLHIDLRKASALFVSLLNLALRSCISATKGCQRQRISSVFFQKNKDDIKDSMQVILLLYW